MPVNPLLAAALRRHGKPLAMLVATLALGLVHGAWFVPLAQRQERALRALGGVPPSFDPAATRPVLPPRVYALAHGNTLPAAAALDQGSSGRLQVQALEELSSLASRAGLSVTLAEPGPVTQLPAAVEVRVRLRAVGGYAEVLALLDRMVASGHVYAVERQSLADAGAGRLQVELLAVRLMLKKAPPPPVTPGDAPGPARSSTAGATP